MTVSLLAAVTTSSQAETDGGDGGGEGSYVIQGKLTPPDVSSLSWLSDTTVIVDGGRRRVFLKEDNSFVIQVEMKGFNDKLWLLNGVCI
jgi:hypothetical protein